LSRGTAEEKFSFTALSSAMRSRIAAKSPSKINRPRSITITRLQSAVTSAM
jgi:hypothetical protein